MHFLSEDMSSVTIHTCTHLYHYNILILYIQLRTQLTQLNKHKEFRKPPQRSKARNTAKRVVQPNRKYLF